MKRGDIWWAELAPSAGKRPVLLLSRNEAYAIRELVTVGASDHEDTSYSLKADLAGNSFRGGLSGCSRLSTI